MTGAMVERQLSLRQNGLGKLVQSQFLGSRYAAASRFFRMFVQSAALGLGALLAIAGYISSGAIIAASILLGRALQPVEALIGGWASLGSARVSLARLADVMATTGDAERIRTVLPKPEGHLRVENVGLRRPDGTPILFGVTFAAEPGHVTGIIGPSGSGKSTLAKVIAGALSPEIGTVRFDGAQRSDWIRMSSAATSAICRKSQACSKAASKIISRASGDGAWTAPKTSTHWRSMPPRWPAYTISSCSCRRVMTPGLDRWAPACPRGSHSGSR
jgi:ABC-type protease/lipase transport system fused ATPase/permease subunit